MQARLPAQLASLRRDWEGLMYYVHARPGQDSFLRSAGLRPYSILSITGGISKRVSVCYPLFLSGLCFHNHRLIHTVKLVVIKLKHFVLRKYLILLITVFLKLLSKNIIWWIVWIFLLLWYQSVSPFGWDRKFSCWWREWSLTLRGGEGVRKTLFSSIDKLYQKTILKIFLNFNLQYLFHK